MGALREAGVVVEMPSLEERREIVTQVISALDANGDGFLSREEMQVLASNHWDVMRRHEISADEWNTMVTTADKNGDGKLSIQELVDMAFEKGNAGSQDDDDFIEEMEQMKAVIEAAGLTM